MFFECFLSPTSYTKKDDSIQKNAGKMQYRAHAI